MIKNNAYLLSDFTYLIKGILFPSFEPNIVFVLNLFHIFSAIASRRGQISTNGNNPDYYQYAVHFPKFLVVGKARFAILTVFSIKKINSNKPCNFLRGYFSSLVNFVPVHVTLSERNITCML